MIEFIVFVVLTVAIRVSIMLPGIVSVALTVWFVRQCYGPRPKRWEARSKTLVPVATILAQDAAALWTMATVPIRRRQISRSADLEGELRDLLGDR